MRVVLGPKKVPASVYIWMHSHVLPKYSLWLIFYQLSRPLTSAEFDVCTGTLFCQVWQNKVPLFCYCEMPKWWKIPADQPEQAPEVIVLYLSGKVLLDCQFSLFVHHKPGILYQVPFVNNHILSHLLNISKHGYWKIRSVIIILCKFVCHWLGYPCRLCVICFKCIDVGFVQYSHV